MNELGLTGKKSCDRERPRNGFPTSRLLAPSFCLSLMGMLLVGLTVIHWGHPIQRYADIVVGGKSIALFAGVTLLSHQLYAIVHSQRFAHGYARKEIGRKHSAVGPFDWPVVDLGVC